MDARRYDRNADQLAQVFWHYTKLQKTMPTYGKPTIEKMLALLEEALRLNDNMGELHEQGLL